MIVRKKAQASCNSLEQVFDLRPQNELPSFINAKGQQVSMFCKKLKMGILRPDLLLLSGVFLGYLISLGRCAKSTTRNKKRKIGNDMETNYT